MGSQQPAVMSTTNILVYLLRKDLRVSDNPILHHLATTPDHGFTHLLPVYVFPSHQIETSGFIRDGKSRNPYPEARSAVAGYRRCGPYRAKFIAEAVWDLKQSYEKLGVGMLIRTGMYQDAVRDLIRGVQDRQGKVGALWMTSEEGAEEKHDEKVLATLCREHEVNFQLWEDEKYLIDDRDLPLGSLDELDPVFTEYRRRAGKPEGPLRTRPRKPVPAPDTATLPPLPPGSLLPPQSLPFVIPGSLDELRKDLVAPVEDCVAHRGPLPDGAESAHPFQGGETAAQARLHHLMLGGDGMQHYKDTRNQLMGTEFSTKLSAYLAQGNLTARQINQRLLDFEDGTNPEFSGMEGFGKGENPNTDAIRYHLLWRDYMRLTAKKYKHYLFRLEGFNGCRDPETVEKQRAKWKTPDAAIAAPEQDPSPEAVAQLLERLQSGMTGMSLIDAAQRELIHTGYTSNRARQNVASFVSKHLYIDWRYGAEWYEMLLIDYDVSSNWGNWQYVAGVGNDPRGDRRIFNPVRQAFEYDKEGTYIRTWVPELRALQNLQNVYQPWTTPAEILKDAGLEESPLVCEPVMKINYDPDHKPRNNRRPFGRRFKPNRTSPPKNGQNNVNNVNNVAALQGVRSGPGLPNSGTYVPTYMRNSWRAGQRADKPGGGVGGMNGGGGPATGRPFRGAPFRPSNPAV